jgi:pilus assembly protein Flp/PilA
VASGYASIGLKAAMTTLGLIIQERKRKSMKNLMARFIREDEGQDLIEYAFLAVFIALVVTAGLTLVGSAVNNKMSTIASSVTNGS